MACSGCAQRRELLVKAGKGLARGEIELVAIDLAEVAQSGIRDASSALRQQTAAARLSIRR